MRFFEVLEKRCLLSATVVAAPASSGDVGYISSKFDGVNWQVQLANPSPSTTIAQPVYNVVAMDTFTNADGSPSAVSKTLVLISDSNGHQEAWELPSGVGIAFNGSGNAQNVINVDDEITSRTGPAVSIFGGAGADNILVADNGTASTYVNGGSGNDTIYVAQGNQTTVLGGAGSDTLTLGGGTWVVDGGSGKDTIIG